jgi:hypothetical protein
MWATKNRHLDSSSRRIRSRLRIGKKYFGSILEGSDCKAIIVVQLFFPILASFLCCIIGNDAEGKINKLEF